MKKIFYLVVLFLWAIPGRSQTIYDCPFKDISGKAVNLRTLSDKPILFILMPESLTQEFLAEIKSFDETNAGKAYVIGIMPEQALTIDTAYSNKPENYGDSAKLILTEGMHFKKNDQSNQSPLVAWLTDKKNHRSMISDPSTPGHKFWVSKNGKVIMVLTPETSLSSPFSKAMLINASSGVPASH